MASSTCVKCGSHQFEVKLAEPKNSRFKVNLVQCASCGGVVGVVDFYNLGELLQDQKKVLKQILNNLP